MACQGSQTKNREEIVLGREGYRGRQASLVLKGRATEREQRRGFTAHREPSDFAPRDSFRFDHLPLEILHFYRHLLLISDVWDAHF